jgi:hypothetical protein
VYFPVLNLGTVDHHGTLVFSQPNGSLQNSGTLNEYCGAIFQTDPGSNGLQGNAAVDKCP